MYRRAHEGGARGGLQCNTMDSFWNEELLVDRNLDVMSRIKCQACDCHFVPCNIFYRGLRWSKLRLPNGLEGMFEKHIQ